MVDTSLKTVPDQDNGPITILIADDHPLLRQSLRIVLEKQADFRVVAEAGDGEESIRLVEELTPNVVIMDIGMPVLNGLEATRQIKKKYPQTMILVLTVHNDCEHILRILEAGAAGYLVKNVFGEEVITAVRAVVSGETVLSPQVLQQILTHAIAYPVKPLNTEMVKKLSAREMEILKLAAKGMSNKSIASELNLNLRSVKGYMMNIFTKLDVGSRTESVITGLRTGLITLSDLE